MADSEAKDSARIDRTFFMLTSDRSLTKLALKAVTQGTGPFKPETTEHVADTHP